MANRLAIADGPNSLAEKIRARIPTFPEAVGTTIKANWPRQRNPKTDRSWAAVLECLTFPILAKMRLDREDMVRLLTALWTSKSEQAPKLRRRIRAMLTSNTTSRANSWVLIGA